MVSEAGVLVGVVGPEQGLTLSAKGGVAVLLRMRFRHGAPLGEWMTMTIGYEPVSLDGQTVPVPVGVSDPRLFRVQRHGGGAGDGSATGSDSATGSGRGSRGGAAAPQLAATGASATTGRAAGAAALATVGGVGLVGYSRRRRRS
jgi:hypothetical protein